MRLPEVFKSPPILSRCSRSSPVALTTLRPHATFRSAESYEGKRRNSLTIYFRHPNLNIRASELQIKFNVLIRMRPRLRASCTLAILASLFSTLLPLAYAQSQVEREWGLFNQILIIGIAVGIVVFGLLFYAVIRYREKPEKRVEKL